MKLTKKFIEKIGSCDGGQEWFEENDMYNKQDHVVIAKLIKQDHLNEANWLITQCMSYKQCLKYTIFAAELVIDIFENVYPDDKRPRECIITTKKCLKYASVKNKTAAYAAAWSAYAAYAGAAAAYAADAYAAYAAASAYAAAAYAADAATCAAHAADAATCAAHAADAATCAAHAAEAAAHAAEAAAHADNDAYAAHAATCAAYAGASYKTILTHGIKILKKEI